MTAANSSKLSDGAAAMVPHTVLHSFMHCALIFYTYTTSYKLYFSCINYQSTLNHIHIYTGYHESPEGQGTGSQAAFPYTGLWGRRQGPRRVHHWLVTRHLYI